MPRVIGRISCVADPVWSDAIGFRNVLAHQYFGIDYEAVWAVVERDMPELKRKVRTILDTTDLDTTEE